MASSILKKYASTKDSIETSIIVWRYTYKIRAKAIAAGCLGGLFFAYLVLFIGFHSMTSGTYLSYVEAYSPRYITDRMPRLSKLITEYKLNAAHCNASLHKYQVSNSNCYVNDAAERSYPWLKKWKYWKKMPAAPQSNQNLEWEMDSNQTPIFRGDRAM